MEGGDHSKVSLSMQRCCKSHDLNPYTAWESIFDLIPIEGKRVFQLLQHLNREGDTFDEAVSSWDSSAPPMVVRGNTMGGGCW